MDANYSHAAGGTRHPRRYLATVVALRRYFDTVLTTWYNSDHRDHLHIDNRHSVGPLYASSTQKTADGTMIQAACNLLNGESLVIDGKWGPLTQAAYLRLILELDMLCYDPKTSTSDTLTLLWILAKTAARDQPAGLYTASCGGPF